MPDDPRHTAVAMVTGDGLIDLDRVFRRDLDGAFGHSKPHQVFAAGYAVCFHDSLRVVARDAEADHIGSSVTARVEFDPDDHDRGLAITLNVRLPRVEPAQAVQLVDAAHQACLYSRATRGKAAVTVVAETGVRR